MEFQLSEVHLKSSVKWYNRRQPDNYIPRKVDPGQKEGICHALMHYLGLLRPAFGQWGKCFRATLNSASTRCIKNLDETRKYFCDRIFQACLLLTWSFLALFPLVFSHHKYKNTVQKEIYWDPVPIKLSNSSLSKHTVRWQTNLPPISWRQPPTTRFTDQRGAAAPHRLSLPRPPTSDQRGPNNPGASWDTPPH